MANVDIQYKGSTIASMGGGETLVLDTQGKYMEDDIIINSASSEYGVVLTGEIDENGGKILYINGPAAEDITTDAAGGDIDEVTGKRMTIAAFPFRCEMADGGFVRLVAWEEHSF